MIKFANQVPFVYPSASRDFQYLCWLFDIVLNSVKHNVDMIYHLPNSQADPKLTELLATTLGFKIKRNYDQAQLKALVSVLPRILKYKGTIVAVDIAGRALLAASGAIGDYKSEVVNNELIVTFPETLIDVALFSDLLVYILPAGMTCHIKRTNIEDQKLATEFDYSERLAATWVPDLAWDDEKQTTQGLAEMFDASTNEPVFTNIVTDKKNNNILIPNVGLLDNSVIPTLDNVLVGDLKAWSEESNEYGTTINIVNYSVEDNEADGKTVIIGGD